MLVEWGEFVVVILLFALVLTQLVVPIWRGTVLFPSFRWKAHTASKMVVEAREDVDLAQATRTARKLKKQAINIEGGAEEEKE